MNFTEPRHTRSAAGVAISAGLHGLAVTAAIWLAAFGPAPNRPSVRAAAPTFVPLFLRAPDIPSVPRVRTKLEPPPSRVEPEPVRAEAMHAPERVERPEPTPPKPTPKPEVARVEPTPILETPKPTPPPVVVGAFDKAANVAQNPTPGRNVATAGFDSAPAKAPETKLAPSTSLGGFERATASAARPGTDRPLGSVAEAGFGGSAPAQTRSQSVAARAEIRAGAFDVETPPAPKAPVTGLDPRGNGAIDMPVQILSKPTPVYTDEARALKLEGDVVLEVEFCATREVRVVRVVRGIGHGLDEAAARAAGQIQFKPAQANGKPIDYRATLHIVFRLT